MISYRTNALLTITARIRRMTGGYVFTGVCLFNFQGGGGRVPHTLDRGEYPIPGLDRGQYPPQLRGADEGGGSHSRSRQGLPHPADGGGVPHPS